MYLSAYCGVQFHRRESLIVFDEVQRFPPAREFIKYLVADGRYDYMETGSLISIKKNVADIVIPSEEEGVSLDPLDFEEYLWAVGEEPLANAIRVSYGSKEPLPEALHRKSMMLWREYLLVGGMPQAVSEYVESKDMERVDRTKRRILRLYRDDISKFAEGEKAACRRYSTRFPDSFQNTRRGSCFQRSTKTHEAAPTKAHFSGLRTHGSSTCASTQPIPSSVLP